MVRPAYGGRNRQRHEQQRRGDDDEGDEKKESAGQGTPLQRGAQYTGAMNIRLSAIEARIIGSADREADHHAGPVPAVPERAGQRLQPEEQS
jgi:hypothetical protein